MDVERSIRKITFNVEGLYINKSKEINNQNNVNSRGKSNTNEILGIIVFGVYFR